MQATEPPPTLDYSKSATVSLHSSWVNCFVASFLGCVASFYPMTRQALSSLHDPVLGKGFTPTLSLLILMPPLVAAAASWGAASGWCGLIQMFLKRGLRLRSSTWIWAALGGLLGMPLMLAVIGYVITFNASGGWFIAAAVAIGPILLGTARLAVSTSPKEEASA